MQIQKDVIHYHVLTTNGTTFSTSIFVSHLPFTRKTVAGKSEKHPVYCLTYIHTCICRKCKMCCLNISMIRECPDIKELTDNERSDNRSSSVY